MEEELASGPFPALTQEELSKKPHPLFGPASIHASLIKGGQALTSYPQSCEAKVIRWIIPGEPQQTVETEIQEILDEHSKNDPLFDASFSTLIAVMPMEISQEEPLVGFMVKVVEQITGTKALIYGAWHWDETALIHNHGIPTVAFGASGEGSHAAVEWCDTESLIQTAKIYESMIRQFCGVNE